MKAGREKLEPFLFINTYTEAWGGKRRGPDPEDKSGGDVDPRLNEDWTGEIGNIFWMEIQVVKAGSNEQ